MTAACGACVVAAACRRSRRRASGLLGRRCRPSVHDATLLARSPLSVASQILPNPPPSLTGTHTLSLGSLAHTHTSTCTYTMRLQRPQGRGRGGQRRAHPAAALFQPRRRAPQRRNRRAPRRHPQQPHALRDAGAPLPQRLQHPWAQHWGVWSARECGRIVGGSSPGSCTTPQPAAKGSLMQPR
jgi:hypothetical protein